MTTGDPAPHGYESQLDEELGLAGAGVVGTHGRPRVEVPRLHVAWSASTRWEAERIPRDLDRSRSPRAARPAPAALDEKDRKLTLAVTG